MTRLIASLVVLGVTCTAGGRAYAQGGPDDTREARGYVTIGAGSLDLNDLNTQLTLSGYPTFPENRLTIGAGGHGVHGRWIVGAEAQAFVGRTKDATVRTQSLEVALNGGYAMANVGYLAFKRGDLHAYPLVGIGGGAAQLEISKRASPSFDEVLADPGRRATLRTGGLVMQVGIGVDQLMVLGSRGTSAQRGLVLGVRVGYVFMPVQSDWRLDSTRIAAGPDMGLSGAYIRFVIGGGGKRPGR